MHIEVATFDEVVALLKKPGITWRTQDLPDQSSGRRLTQS